MGTIRAIRNNKIMRRKIRNINNKKLKSIVFDFSGKKVKYKIMKAK
jgi:hypothetical protein